MNIDKHEAIKRFCVLARRVMEKNFESKLPADCFCGENEFSGVLDSYKFDEAILFYIEDAIETKLLESDVAKRVRR